MAKGFKDQAPEKEPKWEDQVQWIDLTKQPNKFISIRFRGDVVAHKQHWITVKSGKKYPEMCPNWNMDTGEFEDNGCPACELGITYSSVYYANAIVRELQGRRDPNPVQGVMLNDTCARLLGSLASINRGFDVTEDAEGCDVFIQYNPSNPTISRWAIQKSDKSPITETEKQYSYYDFANLITVHTAADIKTSLVRNGWYDGSNPGIEEQQKKKAEREAKRNGKPTETTNNTPTAPVSEATVLAPPPTVVANAPVNNVASVTPVTAGGGGDFNCPQTATDPTIRFGAFKGNITCMRCPVKIACMDATTADGDVS